MRTVRTSAVLLDFDGLICDTERAALRSWAELYARHGLAPPADLAVSIIGRAEGRSVADLASRLGRAVPDADLQWRVHRKAVLAADEPLRPGIAGLLASVARRGLRAAVVSSGDAHWVASHLARLGVANRFRVVVTGDQVARPKPAPDGYLRALELLDVDAGSALAFEDSAVGVAAARAAGIRCVGVPGTATRRQDLGAADAVVDLIADSARIVALLGREVDVS